MTKIPTMTVGGVKLQHVKEGVYVVRVSNTKFASIERGNLHNQPYRMTYRAFTYSPNGSRWRIAIRSLTDGKILRVGGYGFSIKKAIEELLFLCPKVGEDNELENFVCNTDLIARCWPSDG